MNGQPIRRICTCHGYALVHVSWLVPRAEHLRKALSRDMLVLITATSLRSTNLTSAYMSMTVLPTIDLTTAAAAVTVCGYRVLLPNTSGIPPNDIRNRPLRWTEKHPEGFGWTCLKCPFYTTVRSCKENTYVRVPSILSMTT